MARVEGEIMISRSVEEVFDFVADERNEPRYNARMLRAEKLSPGPIGAGTRFRAEMEGRRRPVEMTIEFTAFERPRRLASATHLSAVDIRGELTFDPAGEGMRMRWAWTVEPRGLFKLMSPLIGPMGRRQEQAIWTSLKRLLEGSGGSPPSAVRSAGPLTGMRSAPRSLRRAAEAGRPPVSRKGLRWRATRRERTMRLPGDELVPSALVQTTHAVTIEAPPERVWPWLVQTGQGRAGFYSDSRLWDRCVDWYYRLLSREQTGGPAVGYHVAADDRVVAGWQNARVGDVIADGPPGTAHYVVRHVEPNRAFVLYTDTHLPYLLPARLRENPRLGIHGAVSDSMLLGEPRPGRTRLVRRMRMTCGPWPFRLLALPIVLVWGDLVTERNFLRGVKRRAERAQPDDER